MFAVTTFAVAKHCARIDRIAQQVFMPSGFHGIAVSGELLVQEPKRVVGKASFEVFLEHVLSVPSDREQYVTVLPIRCIAPARHRRANNNENGNSSMGVSGKQH
ncbi:MAG: hypothetical protein HOP03_07205 [Lysobacter sp.]|nr:hypothetical protein [Lysobacter sp.]